MIFGGRVRKLSPLDAFNDPSLLVHGSSLFTINSQHRALTQGTILASKIGETCAPCNQASQILCFLSNNYWNATGGYLTADLNVNNVNRSGINRDVILGSIHVFDVNATCTAAGKILPLV